MPETVVTDIEGNSWRLFEFRGKYFPTWPSLDMEDILSNLPNLPGREDDIMIAAFPKSGTNWIWEIVNMLVTGKGEVEDQNRIKTEGMMEYRPAEALGKLGSVRLLSSHLTPEFYPTDLLEKKAKIVYILRNPKDVLVSYFHFRKRLNSYQGSWDGFFDLVMDGKNPYGPWFEYTKTWDKFFKENPDVPVLTLYYETMKQNLYSEVKKLANFLGVSCDEASLRNVSEKCTFGSMKTARSNMPEEFHEVVTGRTNPLFRKGIIGDWKNHFTVAQNERFDVEYNDKMDGFSFDFEQYMQITLRA